jgi:hypothetical protein
LKKLPFVTQDQATVDKLLKNHHHDRIITIINEKKEEASKKYFESLIKQGEQNNSKRKADATDGKDTSVNPSTELSPIEVVFHKYMKKSLMAYEDYYKVLASDEFTTYT